MAATPGASPDLLDDDRGDPRALDASVALTQLRSGMRDGDEQGALDLLQAVCRDQAPGADARKVVELIIAKRSERLRSSIARTPLILNLFNELHLLAMLVVEEDAVKAIRRRTVRSLRERLMAALQGEERVTVELLDSWCAELALARAAQVAGECLYQDRADAVERIMRRDHAWPQLLQRTGGHPEELLSKADCQRIAEAVSKGKHPGFVVMAAINKHPKGKRL